MTSLYVTPSDHSGDLVALLVGKEPGREPLDKHGPALAFSGPHNQWAALELGHDGSRGLGSWAPGFGGYVAAHGSDPTPGDAPMPEKLRAAQKRRPGK